MTWTSIGRLLSQTKRIVATGWCRKIKKQPYFTHGTMAAIYAAPTTTLTDEKVQIKLSGFDPGSKVTVRSYLPDPGLHFEAHGHFVVDSNGEVSMEQNPSLGGTYTDVEPMGLFWSMTQSPGQKLGLRYAKKDVTIPMQITLSVHKGHLDISALQTDAPVAKTQIQKTYMRPGVEIIKVRSGKVRGKVFKPKGPGPFKGVIDLFGSSGGLAEFRAALLASRGFAAYALPYFRYEDLPTTFERLELDYFEEAVDWLQSQSFVQPGGIGVCGVSYGAEIAALMSTNFPEKISACVSISGSCVHTTIPMSYKGRDIPYLGVDFFRINTIKVGDVPVINMYEACDPLETAPADSIIELEKAQHLLFFVGLDDQNWPAPVFIDGAERRLKALGCNNYEIVRYPGCGHLIEPPYAPVTLVSYYKLADGVIDWGGSLREHQRAQEHHWPKLLQFLDKYVGSQTTSQSLFSKL
ncbi:peroxisomal succinyl-coenzyme A thioesterase-like [Amphiura filiformis]|uniref:peroxisomal succinyl-coenzyme A thioesterase-like n=1 Tax=Amphiura filiformis TaxID=82378 RepID=UPI003B21845E